MYLTQDTNVANLYMAPGYKSYKVFSANIGKDNNNDPILCQESTVGPMLEVYTSKILKEDRE